MGDYVFLPPLRADIGSYPPLYPEDSVKFPPYSGFSISVYCGNKCFLYFLKITFLRANHHRIYILEHHFGRWVEGSWNQPKLETRGSQLRGGHCNQATDNGGGSPRSRNSGGNGGSFSSLANPLLSAHSASTDLAFLSSNHCSLLWTLTSFCFHSKPWHNLLSPWDSPVFKVKCNKRQLVSSRVTRGTAWGSRTAAEHSGDTWGHQDFKSVLMNFLCCWEEACQKHPCCWCWWLPRQEFMLPLPCMETGCGWSTKHPASDIFIGLILQSVCHKIKDSALQLLRSQMIKTEEQLWFILTTKPVSEA